MNKKFTGFTASGLSHPDYMETVGEKIRLQSAITASLLEFMVMTFDHESPEQRAILWDLLALAADRAITLTSALNGVEINAPGTVRPVPPTGKGGEA